MKKIITIAKWEFFGKIRTRSFMIYTVFFPVLVIVIGMVPSILVDQSSDSLKVGIINFDSKLGNIINRNLYKSANDNNTELSTIILTDSKYSKEQLLYESEILLAKHQLDAVLVTSVKEEMPDFEISVVNKFSALNFDVFESACFNSSKEYLKLYSKEIKEIFKPFTINYLNIEDKPSMDLMDAFYKAYFFVMLLAITVLFSGGNFIRNLVEEKNSRIIEILLSSVKTKHLLLGKLLGLGGLSIFQLFIWILIFNLFYPEKLSALTSSSFFIIQILYFLLGYFLYLSIFIGFGTFVHTEQGAQQLSGYLSMILLLPIIISILIIQSPGSFIANLLTYFPLTSAPLMLLKTGFYKPAAAEIIITLTVLLGSILISIFISSKIFRLTAIVDNNKFSFGKLITMLKK